MPITPEERLGLPRRQSAPRDDEYRRLGLANPALFAQQPDPNEGWRQREWPREAVLGRTTDRALSAAESFSQPMTPYVQGGSPGVGMMGDVIPDSEAPALSEYLRSKGTPVRTFVTSLMSHAEVARTPTPGELITMVRAWAELPW